MKSDQLLSDAYYAPNAFLNWLMEQHKIKTDRELSVLLDVSPPIISKIRHRKAPIGLTVLVAAHELTGMKVSDLRAKLKVAK